MPRPCRPVNDCSSRTARDARFRSDPDGGSQSAERRHRQSGGLQGDRVARARSPLKGWEASPIACHRAMRRRCTHSSWTRRRRPMRRRSTSIARLKARLHQVRGNPSSNSRPGTHVTRAPTSRAPSQISTGRCTARSRDSWSSCIWSGRIGRAPNCLSSCEQHCRRKANTAAARHWCATICAGSMRRPTSPIRRSSRICWVRQRSSASSRRTSPTHGA